MLSVTEIRAFMKKVRTLIDTNRYSILNRESYRFITQRLGIKKEDVLNDIKALDTADVKWFEIEDDKDSRFPGKVWQCKKVLHSVEMYIKLKIKSDERGDWLLVMSYHMDV